jgi:hypothetical protein
MPASTIPLSAGDRSSRGDVNRVAEALEQSTDEPPALPVSDV